jgi:hypothetical protein
MKSVTSLITGTMDVFKGYGISDSVATVETVLHAGGDNDETDGLTDSSGDEDVITEVQQRIEKSSTPLDMLKPELTFEQCKEVVSVINKKYRWLLVAVGGAVFVVALFFLWNRSKETHGQGDVREHHYGKQSKSRKHEPKGRTHLKKYEEDDDTYDAKAEEKARSEAFTRLLSKVTGLTWATHVTPFDTMPEKKITPNHLFNYDVVFLQVGNSRRMFHPKGSTKDLQQFLERLTATDKIPAQNIVAGIDGNLLTVDMTLAKDAEQKHAGEYSDIDLHLLLDEYARSFGVTFIESHMTELKKSPGNMITNINKLVKKLVDEKTALGAVPHAQQPTWVSKASSTLTLHYPSGTQVGMLTWVAHGAAKPFVFLTQRHVLEKISGYPSINLINSTNAQATVPGDAFTEVWSSEDNDTVYVHVQPKFIASIMVGAKPQVVEHCPAIFADVVSVFLKNEGKGEIVIDFSKACLNAKTFSHFCYSKQGFSAGPLYNKETGNIIGTNYGINGIFGIGHIAYFEEQHAQVDSAQHLSPFEYGTTTILEKVTEETKRQLIGQNSTPFGNFLSPGNVNYLTFSQNGGRVE